MIWPSRRCTSILILSLLCAGGASAQAVDGPRMELSRGDLESLLTSYSEAASSPAYSREFQAQALAEAALIRARLTRGDFQIGDQITLTVEDEAHLTGTFTVQRGPSLVVPILGAIPLGSVLRSELEPHLREQLGRFIRQPVVHARSSIRVLITGGVAKPAYYVLETNLLLPDALNLAGGPVPSARLDRMSVERGPDRVWDPTSLRHAIVEGRTIDQLSLQTGDQIVIPIGSSQNAFSRLRRYTMGLPAIIVLISAVMKVM